VSLLEEYEDRWIPEPNTGCFLWSSTATRKGDGYAMLKSKSVTRIVLTEAAGPPPSPKHDAAHDTLNGCCGPACVNPAHLRWATRQENAFDIPLGKRIERAKIAASGLTSDQRSELARKLMAGRTVEQRWKNALKGWATRRRNSFD
jgi:hypothetical protein